MGRRYTAPVLVGMVLLAASGCRSRTRNPPSRPADGKSRPAVAASASTWRLVIPAPRALALIARGATLLDARAPTAYGKGHLVGALSLTWQELSQSKAPHLGRLLADDKLLTRKLRAVGIRSGTPVIVYGQPPAGWGEDGRIVWSLRTLGHDRVALVDGGFAALKRAGASVTAQTTPPPEAGDFTVRRRRTWIVNTEGLLRGLRASRGERQVLVDTRERREFEGARPWGEMRGGHLPRALHLHWRTLLDSRGLLRPVAELRKMLARRGLRPGRAIVAYCTGGVRSAWLVVVLEHLGFQRMRNYPGSLWAWAAADPRTHPLITRPLAAPRK